MRSWTERRNFVRGLLAGVLASALVALGPSWTNQEHGGGGKPENWKPIEKMHLYLCAFHIAKENPGLQVEAHHYCAPHGEKLHQCVVYDSRGDNPKLLGVEYIIGNDEYKKLPDTEKKYWHPHAYEILSGQLIAPDMPNEGDDAFPGFLETWGKTWHTWPDPKTDMPLGEPLLMWSGNGDGQILQALIEKRDKEFGISTSAIRERRKALGFAVPEIPLPKSKDELGHIWKATGPDQPTKL